MSVSETTAKQKKFPKKLISISGIILMIIIVCVGLYLYLDYRKNQDLLKNPTRAAQVESEVLVAEIGKLMVLPTDEKPTIATVSDVTKLKDQPFFEHAQNGFKVVIYPKAKKAILYDPKARKIVEVGPVNLAENASPTPSAPVVVAIYNGTTVTGLTSVVEKELKEQGANITVSSKANASKSDYAKTLVIDLTASNAAGAGKYKTQAAALAKLLGGEVGSLPAGETKPKDAEILIILGKE